MRSIRLCALLALIIDGTGVKASDCDGTFVEGLVPLTDLGLNLYQGFPGGLYPNGMNEIPMPHWQAGRDLANQLLPLDQNGQPDLENGCIGFAALGLSNTRLEFEAVKQLVPADPEISSRVVFANGAIGGRTVSLWANPDDEVWDNFVTRIQTDGLEPAQLQIVWLKLAERAPDLSGDFVTDRLRVRDDLAATLRNLKAKFPSVKMVFLSCRTYAGYSDTLLSPEPFAYENGFSVQWVIGSQIAGDADYAFTGEPAPMPWIAWGPYLWANGLGPDEIMGGLPGRSDGLEYECSDFRDDGTHPSEPQGVNKIGALLVEHWKQESLNSFWLDADAVFAQAGPFAPPIEVDANYGDVHQVVSQLAFAGDGASPTKALQAVQLAVATNQSTAAIEAVHLVLDENHNGQVDPTEPLLATSSFEDESTELALDLVAPLALELSQVTSLLVTFDFPAAETDPEQAMLPWLLVFLAAAFLARRLPRLRAASAALILITLAWACSGGSSGGRSGGNGGDDDNTTPPPALTAASFQVTVEQLLIERVIDGKIIAASGLPLTTTTIHVEP